MSEGGSFSVDRRLSAERLSALLTATVPNPADLDTIPHDCSHSPPRSPVMILSPAMPTPDMAVVKEENRSLKTKLRQIQSELQTEQDSVAQLRRKLITMEKERLDSVSKVNEETSRLDGDVAKLRAQIERGEAVRQNLEYELAKVRKEVGLEKRNASERESLMTEVNDTMKQKISELSQQVEQVCEELEVTKSRSQEESTHLRNINEDKEKQLSRNRSEKDAFEAERDRLSLAIQHKDKSTAELEERLQETETESRQQSESLRRQIAETELLREKEERLRRDYECAMDRVRSLEESIEAERAAHLESKFNSEIVQLRIRDLENALELEKSSKVDALTNAEKLNRQIKELQKVYDEERKSSQNSREKMERNWQPIIRAEKEYALLNKQLHVELEEKRSVIKKLSEQLELHQTNFDELKNELNKAKKRQLYLEETYTGSMKELELLLDNFKMEAPSPLATGAKETTKTSVAKKKIPPSRKKELGGKTPSPSFLLEGLRHTLIDYKRKVDDLKNDSIRVKTQNEHLTKESQQYKDMLWAKDKSVETTQQGLTRSTKELRKAQGESRELEAVVRCLQEELEAAKKCLEKERKQTSQLTDKMVKIATKCKTDDETSSGFVQRLYYQLQMVKLSKESQDSAAGAQSSWSDMSGFILDQVSSLITSLQRAEEKVAHFESVTSTKEKLIQDLQGSHEDRLNQLGHLADSRTHEWQSEKEHLEKHYSQLLAELHARQKKTQCLADQAWEKLRQTGSLQVGLESECTDLRTNLSDSQRQRDSLLTCLALLTGAYYPLYTRATALAAQCNVLNDQLAAFDGFKRQVQGLVEVIAPDAADGDAERGPSKETPGGRPILRFRKAVVAVIAANRLANMAARGSCRMFSIHDALPGIYRSLVCTGFVEPISKEFSGVTNRYLLQDESLRRQGEEAAVSWLSSEELLSTVMATMGELDTAIHKANQDPPTCDTKKLLGTARSCFQKFVCHLPSMFSMLQPCDAEAAFRDKSSFIRALGYGLNRTVAQASLDAKSPMLGSQMTLSRLQQHIVEYTQRLHQAEVERRDLRVEVLSLRQERQSWIKHAAQRDQLKMDLDSLTHQVQNSVERDRFDSVCDELSQALQREQEAQRLLNEQGQQLHQLGTQLNAQMSHGSDKEHTLSEAVKGLSETKMDLKRHEQRLRHLNRQVSSLEAEKLALMENVADAETALTTASKDREALLAYMNNVTNVLETTKTKLALSTNTAAIDCSALLSPNLVPSGVLHQHNHHHHQVGPELATCQTLVASFVDAQRQLNAKMAAVQEEILSYKRHISTLKQELNAACKREFDEELEKLNYRDYKTDEAPTRLPFTTEQKTAVKQDDFQPLVEDLTESYAVSPKAKISSPAKSRTVRSQQFHTPHASKRMSTARKKDQQ